MTSRSRSKGSGITGKSEGSGPRKHTPDLLNESAVRAGLGPEAVVALATWLMEQLENDRFARLEQAGHSVEGKIPLARVFIDLEASTGSPERAPPIQDADKGFVHRVLKLKPTRLTERARMPRLDDPREMLAPEFAVECIDDEPSEDKLARRGGRGAAYQASGFVLIGGPGQGKSTLGQLLCQVHRAALLAGLNRKAQKPATRDAIEAFAGARAREEIGEPTEVCLPIRIVLSEAAAWLAKDGTHASGGDLALLRYLAEKIEETGTVGTPKGSARVLSAGDLERLLVVCPFLLVLDGLDEVPATSDRELILAALRALFERLTRAEARGLIVATTRPQGYAGELESLGISLVPRFLAPLSTERALAYAKRLAEARFAEPPERMKRVLDRLKQASTEETTARLMQSPLQVTILATLVDRIGRAPDERWNLFRDYYRVIYEREMERPIPAADLLRTHRAHIDKIHAQVGLLLQVEAERSGGTDALMAPERLLQVVDAVLAEDGIDRPRREELAGQVLRAAKERLVFLVEMRRDRVGFEIRSLQEFMAAWALSSKADGIVEQRLMQVAKTASFRNVVLFVASRCFTELTDLRSAFTDRLCPWMNNDPDDRLAREALAGSVLALEMLEEGSALNQPLYARRLMDLAAKLLDTPPSKLHTRLARVGSTAELEAVLRLAIETRMSQGTTAEQLGGWVTLVGLADERKAWARKLAEARWPATGDEQEGHCRRVVGGKPGAQRRRMDLGVDRGGAGAYASPGVA